MRPPMFHTAYKVTTTRNAYGDFIASASTPLSCHFRYITNQISGSDNEMIQSDAMAWFEADSGVDREDIITFEGEHFRVERVIKARRLRETTVQFIKVELLKYGLIS
jgi:hypothetical protein